MKKFLALFITLALMFSLTAVTTAAVNGETEYAAVPVASVWNGTVATSFAGGNGTENNPYIISNGAQFAYLAANTQGVIPAKNFTSGKFFSLSNSIDFNNIELVAPDSFYGTFLGNGYEISNTKFTEGSMFRINHGTISNLKFKVTNQMDASKGFITNTNQSDGIIEFCSLSGDFFSNEYYCYGICGTNRGTIRYCQVKDATFSGSYAVAGAIAGYFNDGEIHDCYLENITITRTENSGSFNPIIGSAVASMNGTYSSMNNVHAKNITLELNKCQVHSYVGGLIGAVYDGTVTNSSVEAEISILSNSNKALEAGGFTGYLRGDVLNCYSKADITVSENGSSQKHAYGGFTGTQQTGSIVMKCFASGSVYLYVSDTDSSEIYVGGFIGATYTGLVRQNCLADCDVVSYSTEGHAGQFVGDYESASSGDSAKCYYNNTKRFYSENPYTQYATGVSDTLDWDFLKNSITLKEYISESTLENNPNAVWCYFALSDYPTLYSEHTGVYTFSANGGVNAPAGMKVAFENNGVMPENSGTMAGYRFCGWNTKADGTGTMYQPGETCSLTGVNTFYAIWEKAQAEGIDILDSNFAMTIGGRGDLTYKTLPADLIDKNIVWTSSDESVATVNEKGQVFGVGTGMATITAELAGFTDSIRVRVTEASETSGTCGYDAIWKIEGDKLVIEGEGYLYEDYGWYKWTDFADSITCIEFKEGIESVPTYAFENFTKLASVEFPSTMKVIFKGAFAGCTSLKNVFYYGTQEQYKLVGVDVENTCLTNALVHYVSSETAPETRVEGLRTKSVDFNAETKEITVTAYNTNSSAGVALVTEGISDLKAYSTDSGNGVSVATSNGYKFFVAKLANGNSQNFNIYVKVGDVEHIFKVNISFVENNISVESISLDKTELTLTVNESAALTATVLPADAKNKKVTWSTSDQNVATVENGVVTAVGVGKATIYATTVDGGYVSGCEVTVEKAQGVQPVSPIADIATLRCYEASFSDDTRKININVDRFPVVNVSGSLGVAVIPSEGYTVSYIFTGSNGTTSGFSNTSTSKYTLLSSGVNTESNGGGALGNVPVKIFKKENSTRIYVDVVLTKGDESITYKMTIALRDPAVEGDVDILGFQPLRAVRKTFAIDNENKTIYYETEKGVTSAGFAVSVDNNFTKATRPRRLLTAKSGMKLSHGDIKTSGKDIYDRYVVARRSAGETQTYQVKVHGGKDGLTYTWYTVTVVFK